MALPRSLDHRARPPNRRTPEIPKKRNELGLSFVELSGKSSYDHRSDRSYHADSYHGDPICDRRSPLLVLHESCMVGEYYYVFPGVSFSFILRIFRQSCPRLDVSRMDSRTFLSFLNHFLCDSFPLNY